LPSLPKWGLLPAAFLLVKLLPECQVMVKLIIQINLKLLGKLLLVAVSLS
jgi:hypothetical protein